MKGKRCINNKKCMKYVFQPFISYSSVINEAHYSMCVNCETMTCYCYPRRPWPSARGKDEILVYMYLHLHICKILHVNKEHMKSANQMTCKVLGKLGVCCIL
jgi:hypothetical protein